MTVLDLLSFVQIYSIAINRRFDDRPSVTYDVGLTDEEVGMKIRSRVVACANTVRPRSRAGVNSEVVERLILKAKMQSSPRTLLKVSAPE